MLRSPAVPNDAQPTATTWSLVLAAKSGDSRAFGLLYHRYVDSVYRYILFRVGDRSLAEDLTSETFLRALRRIDSVSYQGRDVSAWFITIARNLILDHLKSSRHRLEITTADLSERDNRYNTGPEQRVLAKAEAIEVLHCVRQLNEDQRECVVLRFIDDLSVAETAGVMGRTEGAIKALQHRAMRKLAQLLPTP